MCSSDLLGLQHEDDAVGADVGVRSVEHEEVGEARHRQPEIGAGIALPAVVKLDAIAADDAEGAQEVAGMKAGAVDDRIGGMLAAGVIYVLVAMSAALRRVLTEPGLGARMARTAAELAPDQLWSSVARAYVGLAASLLRRAPSLTR